MKFGLESTELHNMGLIWDLKKRTTKREFQKRKTTESKFVQKVRNVKDIFFENIICTPINQDLKRRTTIETEENLSDA